MTSAHADTLRKGDTLKFNYQMIGCNDPKDRPHAAWPRNASCHVLPSIEWKIVYEGTAFNFSNRADYCIIAARPINVGPPGNRPKTEAEIEAAEKKFCVWVRLNKKYEYENLLTDEDAGAAEENSR
jgi:hypothetical protein